jgi:hypothetical protein
VRVGRRHIRSKRIRRIRRYAVNRVRGWELAAGGTLGLVAGFLLWGEASQEAETSRPETPRVAAPAPDPEVQRLKVQLRLEQARRVELEDELSARPVVPAPRSPKRDAPKRKPGRAKRPGGWIDDDVLLEAGFDAAEVEALNERYEKTELERLFVRDEATREGWFRQPRYFRRMRELNESYDALRAEYGEDRYDWILYAWGRDNRVRVARVMRDSAASDVGLEAGDVILRYDDERIFDARALQQATGEGRAGETVTLEVDRGGERIRLHPPRGPLGVALGSLPVKPPSLY